MNNPLAVYGSYDTWRSARETFQS